MAMDLECRKMGDLLEERQQEMAEILTKENGKPLAEAKVCLELFFL
jgi:acyl-CoA reductase-like NAD-dependent aldehyde dehydrogenase